MNEVIPFSHINHIDYVRDGMDLALCKLNLTTLKLEFAGAVNPCLVVRGGEPHLFKGNRIAIGALDANQQDFTNYKFQLQKGDSMFIYSDGYADQFGGKDGKKMKAPVMRRKLVELAALEPEKQLEALKKHLTTWQGSYPQVDDICVIGVKF